MFAQEQVIPKYLGVPNIKKGSPTASDTAVKYCKRKALRVFGLERGSFLEMVAEYMATNQREGHKKYFYEGRWYTIGYSMKKWSSLMAGVAGSSRSMERYIPELKEMGVLVSHAFYAKGYWNRSNSYSIDFDLLNWILEDPDTSPIKWSERFPRGSKKQGDKPAHGGYENAVSDVEFDPPYRGETNTPREGLFLCIKRSTRKVRASPLPALRAKSRERLLSKTIEPGRQSRETASAGVEVGLVGEANGIGGQLQLLTAFELPGHSAAVKSQNHSDVVSLKNTAGASGGTNTILELAPPRRAAPPNGEAVKVDIGQILAGLSVPDSSHAARRLVAARLESCGFSCQQQYPVASNGYYGQTGRVDIVARRGDLSVAIEIDRRSTRKKSALKLMSSDWIKVSLLRGFANKPFPAYLDFGLILPIGEPAMPLSTKPPSQRRAERLADAPRDRVGSSFPPSGGFRTQVKPAATRKNDSAVPGVDRIAAAQKKLEEAKSLTAPESLAAAVALIHEDTQESLKREGKLTLWGKVSPEVWERGFVGFHESVSEKIVKGAGRGTAVIKTIEEAMLNGRRAVKSEALSAPRTFHPSRVVLGLAAPSVEHEHNGKHGYRAIVFYADESHLIQKTIVFSANSITELVSLDALEIIPGLNGAFLPRLAPNETDLALAGHSFPNLKGSK